MKFSLLNPETKKTIEFPVAPREVQVRLGPKRLTVSPINLGDVDIPKGRVPINFTWSGVLPGANRRLPGVKTLNPNDISTQIKNWSNQERAKRLRLIITSTPWNLLVFVDSFELTHSGGHGDIQYTISLTEWRDLSVRVEKNKSVRKPSKPKKRPVAKPKPRTVTVKSGDTLWGFARRYTGKGTRWPEMWRINKSRSRSKNPNLIYPGEVFKLPSGW